MSTTKQKIYETMTSKQFFIVLAVTTAFIAIAVVVYKKYIKQKINPEYVANKEFIPGPRQGEIPSVDMYFFNTDWCPHCKTAFPIWEKFKTEIGDKLIKDTKINFIEVNCDKEKALAEKYDIKGYPTIKMVNKNKVIEYDAKTDIETLHQFVNSSIS